MRDILELCVELDTVARDTYLRVSAACEDPTTAELLHHILC